MTLNKVCVSIIALVMLAAIPASAALTNLPEGALVSGKTRTLAPKGANTVDIKIEFAIYDTQADSFSKLGLTAPGEGRFLYAYQLFSYSANPIDYFRLTGLSESTAIGSQADSEDAVAPTDSYVDYYYDQPVWEFDGGILTGGKNSAFLLLSSDNGWTKGWFSLTPPSGDPTDGNGSGDDNDNNQVPEPATMLLLAAGSIAAFRRKNV